MHLDFYQVFWSKEVVPLIAQIIWEQGEGGQKNFSFMIKAARFQIESLTIIDAIYTPCSPSLELYQYIL